MAIGTPYTVARGTSAAASGDYSFTTTNAVTAGDLLVVCINNGLGGNPTTVLGITAGGDAMTEGGQASQGTATIVAIYFRYMAAGLASSSTIAVDFSGATGTARQYDCYGVSGMHETDAGTLDGQAEFVTGTSVTSFDTTAMSATTQADDLLIAAAGTNAAQATWTVGTNYTELAPQSGPPGSGGKSLLTEYRIVSGTGTYNATGSYPTSTGYASMVVALKGAVAAGGGVITLLSPATAGRW